VLELLQLLSSLLFFAVYYYHGIYLASLCVSVLSLIQFLVSVFAKLPSTTMNQSSLLLLSLFGFATWFFSNPLFIQWKITIINVIFAISLFMYRYFKREAFFTITFRASKLIIPDHIGRVADNALLVFFLAVATINYWIFTHYSEAVWVSFKTLLLFVNVVYMLFITLYVSRHMKAAPSGSSAISS
jgi:intracellular septation protein